MEIFEFNKPPELTTPNGQFFLKNNQDGEWCRSEKGSIMTRNKNRANGIKKTKHVSKTQLADQRRIKRDLKQVDLTKLTRGRARCDCEVHPQTSYGLRSNGLCFFCAKCARDYNDTHGPQDEPCVYLNKKKYCPHCKERRPVFALREHYPTKKGIICAKCIPVDKHKVYFDVNIPTTFYERMKQAASQKNIPVDDCDEFKAEVETVAVQPCHYCSEEANVDELKFSRQYRIERIDASKGYVRGNLRACCWNCNHAKLHFSLQQVQQYIKDILNTRDSKCVVYPSDTIKRAKSSRNTRRNKYSGKKSKYERSSAKRKAREYFRTNQEIDEYLDAPCHYCQVPQCNGIDRVDPTINTYYGNAVPCCTVCNLIKGDMNLQEFNAWLHRRPFLCNIPS